MMRKLLILLLALALVFSMPAAGWAGENEAPLNSEFAGGSGTEADPWQISTAEQLNNMHNYLGLSNGNKYFILIDDIDLSGYDDSYDDGKGWDPIGNYGVASIFTGSFDGNGKTITGLYSNRPGQDFGGLFGNITNSVIKEVVLLDVQVTGGFCTGGLVGTAEESEITASSVTGTVIGSYYAGGLAGRSWSSSISECSAASTVTAGYYGGGLVGYHIYVSSITNSYATGAVSGVEAAGGLLGKNDEQGSITNSYATGPVSGSTPLLGGLVGHNTGSVSASYYDQQTTVQSDTGKGEPRATADMTDPYNTSNTYLGWDFSGIWDIRDDMNNGYPFLWWQDDTAPVDKAALADAITAAIANKNSVVVSVDGSEVDPADVWVTAAVMTDYESAIAAAQAVYDDGDAYQQQVDDAVTALYSATAAFNAAKQPGTYSAPQTGDELRDRLDTIKAETKDRFADLKTAIKNKFSR